MNTQNRRVESPGATPSTEFLPLITVERVHLPGACSSVLGRARPIRVFMDAEVPHTVCYPVTFLSSEKTPREQLHCQTAVRPEYDYIEYRSLYSWVGARGTRFIRNGCFDASCPSKQSGETSDHLLVKSR